MICPDEALKIIQNSISKMEQENIQVINSLGRIISSDIYSAIDFPSFDKSAMDGYAYNSSDDVSFLQIIETIAAGYTPKRKINKGECFKIMTGAMIPDGTDKVIRFEYTQENNGFVSFTKKENSNNICYKGENLKKGDKILGASTLLRANEIAALSSIGLAEISVYKQPVVGIITTGSEIINPGEKIEPAQIYNSNGPQLFNQIISLTPKCKYYGIVSDDEAKLTKVIEEAIFECDLLILSGGVSKGDYDFVPKILKKLSIDLKFEQVAMKPGKAVVFGLKDNISIIGLPGNPVAAFVTFEIFVKPLILKMMGQDFLPNMYKGEILNIIKRNNSKGRVEYIPVHFDGEYIKTVEYMGSGHINALCKSNAILKMDLGRTEFNKGELVYVRQI